MALFGLVDWVHGFQRQQAFPTATETGIPHAARFNAYQTPASWTSQNAIPTADQKDPSNASQPVRAWFGGITDEPRFSLLHTYG